MIPRQVTGSRGDLKEFKAKVRVMMKDKVMVRGKAEFSGGKIICLFDVHRKTERKSVQIEFMYSVRGIIY